MIRKIFLTILFLYTLIICITSLMYISLNFIKTVENNKYFLDVENNLKRNFIESIEIQKSPCLKPLKNILNLNFGGVKSFCYCNSSKYYEGDCKKFDKTNLNCNVISEMDSKKILNLKKLYFCGKPNIISYDKIENIDKEKKICKNNFKICGKDSLNSLCFPEKINCPINDIIISNFKRPDLINLNYTEKFEKSPSTNENIFLYFTNTKIENKIPVDFKIGLKEICINPEEEISIKKQFIFFKKEFDLKCDLKIGNKNTDFRFSKIYSLDKYL